MCEIPVDAVRPDERGREDRALLGASENAEVRRAAERVRGLKRDASRGLRAEEEGHRDEVGGRENRRGLSRRIEALDHGNEAAVVGRGLGKRDLHRLPRPDLAFREHLPRKDAPGELGRAARHVDNLVICINQNAKDAGQIALMTDHIADLHFNGDTQCFPRWLPGEQSKAAEDTLDFGEPSEMPSGFSQEALPHFQAAYPGKPITEDDLFYYIYGILHSEDYRTRYANNLMKELPRIPRVATYEQFMAFVEAGQELARLHVHFEDVAPYAGVKIEYTKVGQPSYRVTQMKWGKIKGKTGNAAKDKTTLIYNDWITVKNIPLEAQEYVVNKKSALDWVVERACVSIDKASGIVNDFNDYAAEMGSERYPLDLFLKVITVSLETMKIVKALPKIEIHQLDKEASVD